MQIPQKTAPSEEEVKRKAEVRREFGALIKSKRKELGMTQKQLAEAVGVSKFAVSKWELGKHSPEGQSMNRLSEFIGIDRSLVTA